MNKSDRVEKVKAAAYFIEFGGDEGRVRVERRLVQKDERGEIVAEDKGGLEGAGGKWRSPQGRSEMQSTGR